MPYSNKFARLVYLAAELNLAIPRVVQNYVPQGDLVASIAAEGIMGAASQFDISEQQLINLRDEGRQKGPFTEREFRMLLSSQAIINLEEARSNTPIDVYMARMSSISSFFLNQNGSSIVDAQALNLNLLHEKLEKIPKFASGFEPFDLVTGGFYQGLVTITAKTGHGKTTAMLGLMKYIRETEQSDEQWFFENEIPLMMMKWKLKTVDKGFFTDKDQLFCGEIDIDNIIEKVQENPNPNRVIYIDSPDVMAGGSGEGKRFLLDMIFRKLVILKNFCKMVVVSSQGKQKDKGITLESGSDSFDKARYSDIMLGWRRIRMLPDGLAEVKVNVPKNRFGAPEQQLVFHFDYNTFDYDMLLEDERTELFELGDESW